MYNISCINISNIQILQVINPDIRNKDKSKHFVAVVVRELARFHLGCDDKRSLGIFFATCLCSI